MRTQANGEAIRQLREERGLTLTQLARLADISLTYLCRMENGDRNGTHAARTKVAQALGTTTAAISIPVPRAPREDKAAA